MKKLSLKELNRLTPAEFKQTTKTPLIIILDNVRSGLNVGSAFRTADAFALEKIYLCGITATPPHKEILKTAIGATKSVDWEYVKDTASLVKELQNKGVTVLAVEQADEKTWLQEVAIEKNRTYAIVMGNEVKGVSNEVMQIIDDCIEVPQFGTKHSLNIAVCTGIVVWDLVKKIRFEQ